VLKCLDPALASFPFTLSLGTGDYPVWPFGVAFLKLYELERECKQSWRLMAQTGSSAKLTVRNNGEASAKDGSNGHREACGRAWTGPQSSQ